MTGAWLALLFAAGEPAAPLAAQLDAAIAAPDTYDYAKLWTGFAERGDFESNTHYALFGQFANPFAPSDDECTAHAPAARSALDHVPVSLALHYVVAACGDESTAKAHAAILKGLVASQERPYTGRFPITAYRVFHRWDAEALIRSKGYEVHSVALQPMDDYSVAPLSFVVTTSDDPRQFEVYVDILDLPARILERDPNAHPLLRPALLIELADSGLIDPNRPLDTATRVVDAVIHLGAGDIDAERARRSILEVRNADRGAVAKMLELCALGELQYCQANDIDLLLDDAETGNPQALIMLSVLHAKGYLVAANGERALGFYKQLRERSDADYAAIHMAAKLSRLRIGNAANAAAGPLLAALVEDLVKAAPNFPPAHLALGWLSFLGAPGTDKMGTLVELAERAWRGGFLPAGLTQAAPWSGDPAQRERAIERLTEINSSVATATSRFLLGNNLRAEGRYDEAGPWIASAAGTGSPAAMLIYADEFFGDSDERAAMGRALLHTAFALKHLPALPALVDSYIHQPASSEEMLEVYNMLVAATETTDLAIFHLALGRAEIAGLGGKKQLRRGLKSVRHAQKRGSPTAFLYEYELIESGQLRASSWRKRVKLLDGALDFGAAPAIKATVGRILYSHRESTSTEQDRGLRLMVEAEEGGQTYVLNDAAWSMCTERGDTQRGWLLARRALERRRDGTTLDTTAACAAVNGDFAAAIELQTAALQAQPDDPRLTDVRERFEKRLANYRAGNVEFGQTPTPGDSE